MIYEYALDPGLLNNEERFRYLIEKFGVSQGRLISRYPKNWKEMVYNAMSGVKGVAKSRIELKLKAIDEKMLTRENQWDDKQSWPTNAELEHARKRFQAIITQQNPNGRDFFLVFDDLDEDTPLFKIKREDVIPRTAAKIAEATAPLLRNVNSAIFIDPHFSPYKPKALNTLKYFMRACIEGRGARPLKRIEFHTESKLPWDVFSQECQRVLPNLIPIGVSVKVVRWRARVGGEGLHNRYILTDRGGLGMRWGLDEGAIGQTDDIGLLDKELYDKRWAQYCGPQPAFDLIDELVVIGTLQRN